MESRANAQGISSDRLKHRVALETQRLRQRVNIFLLNSTQGEPLAITRVGDPSKPPMVFLAGLGGHSGLFYNDAEQAGLAGYLAREGFCCYCIDLQGKGVLRTISAANDGALPPLHAVGLHHWVTDALPVALEWIGQQHPGQRQAWIGHGMGGLLWWAVWARYPEFRYHCDALLQVASARTMGVCKQALRLKQGSGYRLKRSQASIWRGLHAKVGLAWVNRLGYVPLRSLGLAPEDESASVFRQWLAWCQGEQWVDSEDGFPYGETIRQASKHPRCSYWLSEMGRLVTERDVRAFMGQIRLKKPRLFIIKEPFDNVSLLTSPRAVDNHFHSMASWLKGHDGGVSLR